MQQTTNQQQHLKPIFDPLKGQETVMKVTKVTFKNLPYIILYAIGFILIGLTNLAKGSLQTDTLTSWSFWYSTITIYMAIVVIIIGTLLQMVQTLSETDLDFENYSKELQSYIDLEHNESFLDEFIALENARRKKKAWKVKWDNKLKKLENKAKPKDNQAFMQNKDTRYTRLKRRYTEFLTDSYIDTNLDYLKIKYKAISRALMQIGVKEYEEEDYIEEKPIMVGVKDLLPKMLLGFGWLLFLNATVFQFLQPDIQTFIAFFTNTGVLVYYIILTRSYAKIFFKKTTIRNIVFRIQMFKNAKKMYSNQSAAIQ
jgi:hypothetical protein